MENGCVVEGIREFMLGGKAEFTVLNTVNNVSYKYHLKANKEYTMWFVHVRIAGSFKYAGFIKKGDTEGTYVYYRGKKGTMDASNTAIKGLLWVLHRADVIPHDKVKIYHHGRCSACGKPLTDELSIQRGMGPVCYSRAVGRGL